MIVEFCRLLIMGIVELKKEASESLIEGQRLLTKCDFEGACNELAKSCEALSAIHGETSPHCLRVLMLYGGALLSFGRQANGALKVRGRQLGSGEESAMDVDAKEDIEDKISNEDDPKMDGGLREVDPEDDEDDEPDDNLKLAVAIFDLAIRICDESASSAKSEEEVTEVQVAKSDSLLRKSEALQELDQFEEALTCCQQSIAILMECKAQDVYRLLAEAYYLLGVNLDNMEKFTESIKAFEETLSYLSKQLKKTEDEGGDSIDDIKDLIKDVAGKIVDLRMASDSGIQQYLKNLTSSGKTLINMTKEQTEKTVTDLTAKIRKLPITQFEINDDAGQAI